MESPSESLVAKDANQAVCSMLQSPNFDIHHLEQYLLQCQGTGRSDFQDVLDGRATDSGRTPLHIAVRRNFVDAVQSLIQFGASIDSRGLQGETPLMLCCAVSATFGIWHFI